MYLNIYDESAFVKLSYNLVSWCHMYFRRPLLQAEAVYSSITGTEMYCICNLHRFYHSVGRQCRDIVELCRRLDSLLNKLFFLQGNTVYRTDQSENRHKIYFSYCSVSWKYGPAIYLHISHDFETLNEFNVW